MVVRCLMPRTFFYSGKPFEKFFYIFLTKTNLKIYAVPHFLTARQCSWIEKKNFHRQENTPWQNGIAIKFLFQINHRVFVLCQKLSILCPYKLRKTTPYFSCEKFGNHRWPCFEWIETNVKVPWNKRKWSISMAALLFLEIWFWISLAWKKDV